MADLVKWRTGAIALGATLAVALGGAWAANATGIFDRPAPEPTSVVQEEPTSTPSVTPTPTPTPTVAPAVEAPPVVEAPVEEPPYYGEPIPWIADPNNAEGGYYDTTQCPSSAGYQAPDGNQYCAP